MAAPWRERGKGDVGGEDMQLVSDIFIIIGFSIRLFIPFFFKEELKGHELASDIVDTLAWACVSTGAGLMFMSRLV
jgi:hypothetical protein